jgi:hypothetical protein
MILDKIETSVYDSDSVLSFESDGINYWEGWDRFITIKGKRAFHIGNVCGTCNFVFERLDGVNQSVNPEQAVNILNKGVEKLEKPLMKILEMIIPDGDYLAILSEVNPILTSPGDSNDYFANEQIDLCGLIRMGGKPHSPKTEYYRLNSKHLNNGIGFYEFLIPIVLLNFLDSNQVKEYKDLLRNGQKPSMVTLSLLDIWTPEDLEGEKEITKHWCLAHYLIDGHHKAFAAAQENKPLTMISFLAVKHGLATDEEINKLLEYLDLV